MINLNWRYWLLRMAGYGGVISQGVAFRNKWTIQLSGNLTIDNDKKLIIISGPDENGMGGITVKVDNKLVTKRRN